MDIMILLLNFLSVYNKVKPKFILTNKGKVCIIRKVSLTTVNKKFIFIKGKICEKERAK